MSLLLQNAVILDVSSPYHKEKKDILVEDGRITFQFSEKNYPRIDLQGKLVSPGWFDLSANFNDPGREHKEDIESGISVASSGGFTDVQLIPDTYPPIETKTDVNYLKSFTGSGVDLRPSGAISEGLKGENLCEILDLNDAGAVSVSDGDNAIWNSKLLLKALQYSSQVDLRVFQNPRDSSLSNLTDMHEGLISTELGLRGEPSLSEELTIKRDLDILKYAGGKLHFSRVSTANAVSLIKEAKENRLDVTADVALHNLLFTDASIGQFDTNFKTIPPYRTLDDRKALLEGVRSGVIDAICSNHRPQDQESKQLEFDLADPGVISLQTFYPALLQISEVPFEILVQRITEGPRKVLGLDNISIEEGYPAKLTVLDENQDWALDSDSNFSKSINSPFWGQKLHGKVLGIVNGEFQNLN